jgi:hypothetical protein
MFLSPQILVRIHQFTLLQRVRGHRPANTAVAVSLSNGNLTAKGSFERIEPFRQSLLAGTKYKTNANRAPAFL